MNPILDATLRRHWPLLGAIAIFLVFIVTHQFGFRPVASRYQRVVKRAAELGLSTEPGRGATILPPRVFALLADNSMPAALALELGSSGALTARLLEDLSNATSNRRIQVLVTEPGAVTQQPNSVEIRAHLKLRCTYPQFVGLLDDLARGPALIAVDRFQLTAQDGPDAIEMWASRLLLKKGVPRK